MDLVLLFVFRVLQRVPLRYGSARRRQHVRPVAEFRSTRVVAQHHLPDRLRSTNSVVVHHRDNQIDFLKRAEIEQSHRKFLKFNRTAPGSARKVLQK